MRCDTQTWARRGDGPREGGRRRRRSGRRARRRVGAGRPAPRGGVSGASSTFGRKQGRWRGEARAAARRPGRRRSPAARALRTGHLPAWRARCTPPGAACQPPARDLREGWSLPETAPRARVHACLTPHEPRLLPSATGGPHSDGQTPRGGAGAPECGVRQPGKPRSVPVERPHSGEGAGGRRSESGGHWVWGGDHHLTGGSGHPKPPVSSASVTPTPPRHTPQKWPPTSR